MWWLDSNHLLHHGENAPEGIPETLVNRKSLYDAIQQFWKNLFPSLLAKYDAVLAHKDLQRGLSWGKKRSGHPEGSVAAHVKLVENNLLNMLQDQYITLHEYITLMFVALIHDSFKHAVDLTKPKVGDNHHGHYAAKFAKYMMLDRHTALLIRRHDDAYNFWRHRDEAGCAALICDLEKASIMTLYLKFMTADSYQPGKSMEPVVWFANKIGGKIHERFTGES